ncbi:MAG TPA: hypothetical protein VHS96_13445 [Bacteroidia bacterium]|nr:hypothetical protein [Bacteroidia bacterium]
MKQNRQFTPEQLYAMGFDQNDPSPIVNVHKRTTKVNLWMVVGVVAFFIIGGLGIWLYTRMHGAS